MFPGRAPKRLSVCSVALQRKPRDRSHHTPRSNSIFNSAVVPFDGGFAGVFRIDDTRRIMDIHSGKSRDGWNWGIQPDPIDFVCDDPEIGRFEHRYDRASVGSKIVIM